MKDPDRVDTGFYADPSKSLRNIDPGLHADHWLNHWSDEDPSSRSFEGSMVKSLRSIDPGLQGSLALK